MVELFRLLLIEYQTRLSVRNNVCHGYINYIKLVQNSNTLHGSAQIFCQRFFKKFNYMQMLKMCI